MKFDNQSSPVRTFILKNLEATDLAKRVVAEFDISRQAYYWHIKRLVQQGIIRATGATRRKGYELVAEKHEECFAIHPGVEEDQIWREQVAPLLADAPKNVFDICQHGFTEIVNNCISHSEAAAFWISIQTTPIWIRMSIGDPGVGIFAKIQKAFGLADKRYAILELTKGKLTTDPSHHSGEGIFFTSRAFDQFSILSSGLFFRHTSDDGGDWLIETESGPAVEGTFVTMEIPTDSRKTIDEVFLEFAGSADDFAFRKTHVPVKLARYGEEKLVSRSQAKRVLSRFEKFREVMLDFSGIESIGQAFADEIFRVFGLQNPNVEVLFVDANPEVEKMIRRVLAESQSEQKRRHAPRLND